MDRFTRVVSPVGQFWKGGMMEIEDQGYCEFCGSGDLCSICGRGTLNKWHDDDLISLGQSILDDMVPQFPTGPIGQFLGGTDGI